MSCFEKIKQTSNLKKFLFLGGIVVITLVLVLYVKKLEGLITPIQSVTITTDKTEYKQGEIVRVLVKNNLNKTICFGTCNPCYLEKKNGNWEAYSKLLCSRNFIGKCLRPKGTIIFEPTKDIPYIEIEKGIYRVVCHICIDCESENLILPFRADKVIYSNEFTIK